MSEKTKKNITKKQFVMIIAVLVALAVVIAVIAKISVDKKRLREQAEAAKPITITVHAMEHGYFLDADNNKQNSEKIMIKKGGSLNLPSPMWEEGYGKDMMFLGWYSDKDFVNYIKPDDKGYTKLSNDIAYRDVYPRFVYADTDFTVIFDSNGGKFSDGSKKIEQKMCGLYHDYSMPALSRKGYKFCGWYTDKECTQKAFSDEIIKNISVDRDTDYYAGWKKAFRLVF